MFVKKDYEEKKTKIEDSYQSKQEVSRVGRKKKDRDPVLEHIIKEKKKQEISISEEKLELTRVLVLRYSQTKTNSKKLEILDEIGKHIFIDEVRDFLVDIVKFDGYKQSRVKALSILSDRIKESEVEYIFFQALNDSSPDVRLWSVWGLRDIINKPDVQSVLLRKLKFEETSNKIKLWIIRALSDQLDNRDIKNSFMFILKLKPSLEIRKLILYYLIKYLSDPEIAYSLSTYVHLEKNKEIRLELIKELIKIDNEDIQYSLSKIQRLEMDEEIQEIFLSKV